MRNMFLLALNTLKITFRKKINFFIFFVFPILGIFLSLVFNNPSGKVIVGICNNDNKQLSNDMVASIKSDDKFTVVNLKENEIKAKVSGKEVDCVLVIPNDFEDNVYKNQDTGLKIVSIRGTDVTAWINMYVNGYTQNLQALSKASNGNTSVFNNMYQGFQKQEMKLKMSVLKDNQKGKSASYQSIGFLIMFMLLGASNTTAFIIDEKRSRTYFRIFSAPVTGKTYLGGNIICNLAIIFIQSVILIFAVTKIFGINTFVPDLQLLAILMCFGLVSIGLGIMIASFSEDASQAGSISTLVITPSCMLGGCFWPVEYMPGFMQQISNFMPQRWVLQAIGRIQSGSGFTSVLGYLAVVLCFALAFFLIGIYKLNHNDNVKNFI